MNWSAFNGHRIYLDANAVIYAFESGFTWREAAIALFTAADRGALSLVTSELTIAEVLLKPIQQSDLRTIEVYEQLFSPESCLDLISVSQSLLFESARVGAATGLKVADAIHLATARARRCEAFLTHDQRVGRALSGDAPRWLRYSDIAP